MLEATCPKCGENNIAATIEGLTVQYRCPKCKAESIKYHVSDESEIAATTDIAYAAFIGVMTCGGVDVEQLEKAIQIDSDVMTDMAGDFVNAFRGISDKRLKALCSQATGCVGCPYEIVKKRVGVDCQSAMNMPFQEFLLKVLAPYTERNEQVERHFEQALEQAHSFSKSS